jgi:hypothetical protein
LLSLSMSITGVADLSRRHDFQTREVLHGHRKSY